MLSRIPSWAFALSYLMIIPLFALLYTCFADEFYHPMVKHERYLQDDEKHILESLRQSIIENYEQHYGTRSFSGRWNFNWDEVYLYDLQFQQGYYSFAFLGDPSGRQERLPPGVLRFKFALFWDRPFISQAHKPKMYGLLAVDGREKNLLKELFPINPRYSDEAPRDDLGYVIISDTLQDELLAWTNAIQGFPSKSTGTYWRLLYLSAVTITTVGFGDIVPVTTRARLWVGAEAILGVMIAGLFLNSLAKKMQPRG